MPASRTLSYYIVLPNFRPSYVPATGHNLRSVENTHAFTLKFLFFGKPGSTFLVAKGLSARAHIVTDEPLFKKERSLRNTEI